MITESCARCGRQTGANGPDPDWELIGGELACPDCVTPEEENAIDDDYMAFGDAVESWYRQVGISTDLPQSDYAEEKVRENRLRRMAHRQGYHLVKSRSRDPRALDFGLYKIVDPRSNTVAAGNETSSGHSLTIDEVERWLTDGSGVPGLIFAFRDDDDGDRVGKWHPHSPDAILLDGMYTVGAPFTAPAASRTLFAGHRLVFAYEDRPSGRLPDDSPGHIYRLGDKKPRCMTLAVHRALWGQVPPSQDPGGDSAR